MSEGISETEVRQIYTTMDKLIRDKKNETKQNMFKKHTKTNKHWLIKYNTKTKGGLFEPHWESSMDSGALN